MAQDEARGLRHNYIGTEHILLGLLREHEGLAARALATLGIDLEQVRREVMRVIGLGDDDVTAGQIPFTPRAKKVLDFSLREAVALGHNYIGTEHLLLGLTREPNGVAMQILAGRGADGQRVREAVIDMLGGQPPEKALATAREQPGRRPRGFAVWTFLAGWLLFAAAVGIGILIGWAIWG